MEQIQMVQIELLRPHEQNPRIDAASVAELVESIRVHGIEVPLVAAPVKELDDSCFVVLAGHRRLTAAHEVGLSEVPVQIRADLTEARDQLAFMATENILRDQLTAVEESRLVQDMLDLGMTQAEVARQTALGKKRVAERVKLGKLAEGAGEKVHRGQITVDDALIIAEYSDDPDAAAALEQTAGTNEFDYKVSAARRAREDRQRTVESQKEAKKRGLRLATDIVRIEELVREGRFVTEKIRAQAADDLTDTAWADLLDAEHASCPGHSAGILEKAQWINGLGNVPAGTLFVGCDQWETQHPADAPTAEAGEPEHDPWDDLDPEDFATAKIHRERHLAAVLPTLDTADVATKHAVAKLVKQGWNGYGDDQAAIDLLQTLTGAEGKSKVSKALSAWPLSLLVWLEKDWWSLKSDHKYMTDGRQGSSYWGAKGALRQLLERSGYEWTPVEQQAILLATGIAHDADPEADGAEELAEGGEAA